MNKSSDVELGKWILHPQDLVKTVDTEHGQFTIKLLSPTEKRALIRKIAQEAGAPIESLAQADYVYIVATCTVALAITSAPTWWKGVDSCRDEELLLLLYSEYKDFESDFARRLRSGGFDSNSTGVTA